MPVAEQQEVIASILAMRAERKPLRAIQAALGDRLSLEAINRICREITAPAIRFEQTIKDMQQNEALKPWLDVGKL